MFLHRTTLPELYHDRKYAFGQQPARWEPVDIEEMRRMVAEELTRALAGRSVASEAVASADVDMEKKYGAKLDRMLGGLAAGSPTGSDG